MKLSQLLSQIKDCSCQPRLGRDFTVKGISCNSREVKPGFIFVAVKGAREDGHKFIEEALRNGAGAVVFQSQAKSHKPQDSVSFIKVKDTRKVLGKLAAAFYRNPSRKIKAIGITGTNGKTTITYLIEAVLKEAGLKPAVIGTINYRFKNRVIASGNTTPGPLQLQSMLQEMLKEGINYAVMEVSSHALDQARTEGINFHSAIFTNLTQDHLDYHNTLEKYFLAKSRLFRDLSRTAVAVINNDSSYASRLKKITPAEVFTYGIDAPADIVARDICFRIDGAEFTVVFGAKKLHLKTALIGRHNVYNLLAVFAWALGSGISQAAIKNAIEKFRSVPGRLEKISAPGGFSVFVDYAHTQDALENVITALRQVSKNRLIVVFGCGGERDKTKRPKMGRAVSQLADYAIITSDNPRSEDPRKIIEDIRSGIKKDNYAVVPERLAAIKKSLRIAGPGDVVLVAGKGHENYQVLKDRTIPFDDREAVRRCLKSMN